MDDYSDVNDRLIAQLKAKVAAYNEAAIKFLSKVDNGQAKSKVTYAELKAAFNLPEAIGGYKL